MITIADLQRLWIDLSWQNFISMVLLHNVLNHVAEFNMSFPGSNVFDAFGVASNHDLTWQHLMYMCFITGLTICCSRVWISRVLRQQWLHNLFLCFSCNALNKFAVQSISRLLMLFNSTHRAELPEFCGIRNNEISGKTEHLISGIIVLVHTLCCWVGELTCSEFFRWPVVELKFPSLRFALQTRQWKLEFRSRFANVLVQDAEYSHTPLQSKDVSVFLRFGANNCVSTKFTVASVVLHSLHGSFKVTTCFSVLRALRVFPWLCNRRMIVEFASRRLIEVNCVLSRVWIFLSRSIRPNERKLRLCINTALEMQLWLQLVFLPRPWSDLTLPFWEYDDYTTCFLILLVQNTHKTVTPPISHLVTFFSFKYVPKSAIQNNELSNKYEAQNLTCVIHIIKLHSKNNRFC